MIQANELRVGNIVMVNYKPTMVTEIMMDMLNTYNPISLSEMWLLRFGFVKYTDVFGECFYEHEMDIQVYLDSNTIWFGNKEFEFNYMPVHRFQNIYYALNGIEVVVPLSTFPEATKS